MNKIREVIIYWVRKTGLKVLLAPEAEREIMQAKEMIYEKLPADVKANVVHKAEWWNMDQAIRLIKCHIHLLPWNLILALWL